MADPSAKHWYPTAAYLYVLHLDGLALAWEYLRRHPDYRHDWLRRRRRPEAAKRWGLRVLEDPGLDARNAHPVWFPDHDSVVQLYPDADPPPNALVFEFWRIPGDKRLIHDGKRLMLVTQSPDHRSEEHTSELQSLMRISYAVFCLNKKHQLTQMQKR